MNSALYEISLEPLWNSYTASVSPGLVSKARESYIFICSQTNANGCADPIVVASPQCGPSVISDVFLHQTQFPSACAESSECGWSEGMVCKMAQTPLAPLHCMLIAAVKHCDTANRNAER